jgi:outer membrane protein
MKWCLIVLIGFLSLQPSFAQDAPPSDNQILPQRPSQPTAEEAAKGIHEMSVDQAMALALKYNLDLEVQRYNPPIDDTFVGNEKSRFQPLFTADVEGQDQELPTSSSLVGTGSITNKSLIYDFTLGQLLPTSTLYNIQFFNTRFTTDQFFNTINPRYDTSLFLNVTQPLLRNFGKSITLTPLNIAKQNKLTSDYHLQQQVGDLVLAVEQAYWDLAFARGELIVAKQSYKSAEDLYENNKKQVEVGTLAPLDVVTAQAEVAAREQDIIVAETAILNLEERLKTLIYGNQEPAERQLVLIPVDVPQTVLPEYDDDTIIKKGLADNPDLKAFESDLSSKSLSTKLAKNELKYQLDLKGTAGTAGLGGTRLLFGGDDPFNPIFIGQVPGGYNDALSDLFNHPTFSIGVLLGIPIGNGNAKADYTRAHLTEQQAGVVYQSAKEQLLLNIRTSLRNLKSDLKRLDAARASEVLQVQKLDAEQKKLAVGLSTNHTVLDFQDDLAQAQSQVLLAIVNYTKDKAQLKRFLGILPSVQ